MKYEIIQTLNGTLQRMEPHSTHPLLHTLTIDDVDYQAIYEDHKVNWAVGDKVTFTAGMRFLQDATLPVLQAWHLHKAIAPTYALPAGRIHEHWNGCESKGFSPDFRQEMVMQACRNAIAAGLFYNCDCKAYVVQQLGIDQTLCELNTMNVEGGNVGMDIYYARNAVHAAEKWELIQKTHDSLQPVVGMVLGTLSINRKKTTNCVISKVHGSLICMTAKRGRFPTSFECDVLQLLHASIDAHEKGWRLQPLCAA